MTTNQYRTALRRTVYIAAIGALIFAWLIYTRPAHASMTMLLRLHHDQDGTGTVTDGDIVAAGVEVTVTERCTISVCAASPSAYVVVTDSAGYATITLHDGEYEITAPCMVMTVAAADVSGQAQQDTTTCLQGVRLAEVMR